MLKLKPQLVTQYHVGIATPEWLRHLTSHVRESIAKNSEYRTSSGTGIVSSQYNEDRFMGPLSLVKNDFVVNVRVSRGLSLQRDRFEAVLRFNPESMSFEDIRETIATVETTRRDNRNFKRVKRLCEMIASGCEWSVVDAWRCPWCDAHVRVSFHSLGRTFAVSCDNHHFFRHETTATPPNWWRNAIADGWLDSDSGEATEHIKD